MNLFGRQVSIAVLISFIVTLTGAVGGTWIALVNNFGKQDPTTWIVAALSALGFTITTAVHTWDTSAGQPAAKPPAAGLPQVLNPPGA